MRWKRRGQCACPIVFGKPNTANADGRVEESYGRSASACGGRRIQAAGGQGDRRPRWHRHVVAAQQQLGLPRPGLPHHGAMRIQDHVYRRRAFDSAIPGLPDRAAV